MNAHWEEGDYYETCDGEDIDWACDTKDELTSEQEDLISEPQPTDEELKEIFKQDWKRRKTK